MQIYIFFFFNDTATTEIYTLSLHDALPISLYTPDEIAFQLKDSGAKVLITISLFMEDRKSTRLNSSHANISYAVFCLKKKKNKQNHSSYNIHNVHTINSLIY